MYSNEFCNVTRKLTGSNLSDEEISMGVSLIAKEQREIIAKEVIPALKLKIPFDKGMGKMRAKLNEISSKYGLDVGILFQMTMYWMKENNYDFSDLTVQ